MKRIATILNTSEISAVRKAVTAAGASLVRIAPIVRCGRPVELGMWYRDSAQTGDEQSVRLEVVSEDADSDAIISAILANARVGGIENVVPFPAPAQRQAGAGQ